MLAVFKNGRRQRFDVGRLLDRMSRTVVEVDQVVPLVVNSALPLPGMGDAKSNIESIAAALQAIPYERSRCSALALKVRSLSGMIDDLKIMELDLVDDIAKQIHEMKQDLDKASASCCSTVRRADRVIEMLEGIKERTDCVITVIQTQLQLQKSTRDDYQHMIVKEHEIADQTVVPFERWTWTNGPTIQLLETSTHRNVTESRRIGRVGDISVFYTKYTSIRALDAEKMARARADWHQRCLHPNVASVFGVTTGRRLNGVVLATGALSLETFWSKVQSPRAVAQCMTDILTLPALIELEPENETGKILYTETFQVGMDGRISFTLTDDINNWVELSNLSEYKTKPQSEWILAVIDICGKIRVRDWYSAFSGFLAQLALVSDGCTELTMQRLADSTNVPPGSNLAVWNHYQLPPFTLCAGDAGVVGEDWILVCVYQGEQLYGFEWDVHSHSLSVEDTSQEEVWFSQEPRTHNSFDFVSIFQESHDYQKWNPCKRAGFWKDRLRDKPVATVEDLSVCISISYSLSVLTRGTKNDATRFYHHRRPFAVSHPRDFWGYLSFSADPADRNSDLELNGWVFCHTVCISSCKLVDNWGYRYRRLLRKSMRKLPGNYPTEEEDNALDLLLDDDD